MRQVAQRGPKILWGDDPFKPGIIENMETGESVRTPTSVASTLARGYWYSVDEKNEKHAWGEVDPTTMEPS